VVSRSAPCSNDPDPCRLNSGFPGDEYCLLPPADGEGIQIHFGPKEYNDADAIESYMMEPGNDSYNSVLARVLLTSDKYYARVTVHARPGLHHWTSMGGPSDPNAAEAFYPDTACGQDTTAPGDFGGGQNLIYDNPPMGVPAPENEGLGRLIRGNTNACMRVHTYNMTDKPLLREMWLNLYFIDPDEVTQHAGTINLNGGRGLNLPPGQAKILTYESRFSRAGRIIQLSGHRHKWTPRFAVWLNDDLVYDSNIWVESVTFSYDSLIMNPPINTKGELDGAVSGVVRFEAGDTLRYSCFIENGSDQVLRFNNAFDDGEQCNLFGVTIGESLSGTFQ
jgi:hypothetical protein